MELPIWVVVFWHDGEWWTTVQCASELEAERTIYHNTYYHRPCLKIRVKAWRS